MTHTYYVLHCSAAFLFAADHAIPSYNMEYYIKYIRKYIVVINYNSHTTCVSLICEVSVYLFMCVSVPTDNLPCEMKP